MKIRNERTGAAGRPLDRHAIARLAMSNDWPAMLDLFERTCVQEEAELLNCLVEDEPRVLALHKVVQAQWKFFIKMQLLIAREVEQLTGPQQSIDAEIQKIQSIMNPLVPGPDELEGGE